MNIAICDDEKAIREQIKELIEKMGVCPELYETGDSLLAAGKQFDIVFLDIQMEGTNGMEGGKSDGKECDHDTCHGEQAYRGADRQLQKTQGGRLCPRLHRP